MSGEVGLNMFAERINELTRPCPAIGVIRLFIKGQLIRVLVNTPGQSAALRVIANFQFNNKPNY
jgi:hypothetical protein